MEVEREITRYSDGEGSSICFIKFSGGVNMLLELFVKVPIFGAVSYLAMVVLLS